MSLGNVPGPDAGGQAVDGIVCGSDRSVVRIERQRRHDGSEDLLLNDGEFGLDVNEDGRLDEVALIAPAVAARQCTCAVGDSLTQVAGHLVELLLRDQRSELGGGIEAGPDLDLARCVRDGLGELLEDGVLDVQTSTRNASTVRG